MVKGQAALEMIISVGFLLLVMIVVSFLAYERNLESSELKTMLDAKRIGESLKDNIGMISQQGSGYFKYYSLPERIHGDYEYNLTIGSNILEVAWEGNAWSTQIITPDVRVFSMDRGLGRQNRIMNRGGVIEISGHRPNLVPVCDSVQAVVEHPGVLNVSFYVINDAHVEETNITTIALTQLHGPSPQGTNFYQLGPIQPYDKAWVTMNHTDCGPGESIFIIRVDYYNDSEEGIESDNECNISILFK